MSPVSEYLEIPNRRDDVAVRAALERVITQAQTPALGPQNRDSLIRVIISDLAIVEAHEAAAEKPIWKTWDVRTHETALECIKVLSRSSAGTSHLTTRIALRTLIHHARYPAAASTDITKGQEHAVSALCNTLLLHQNAPSLCVKEGLGDWALSQIAGDADNGQDQTWPFLMGRIIMVLTSRATYGFLERLLDELDGLSVIKARLEAALQHPDQSQLALVEFMKILYHVFALYPETKNEQWDQRFDGFSSLILDLLLATPTDDLAPPVTNMINVLTRFSPETLSNSSPSLLKEAAMKIFRVTTAYVETTLPPPPWKPGDVVPASIYDTKLVENLDQILPPPLLVLVNMMNADGDVKRKIREKVMPADLDRSIEAGPLEERADVLGYLLRLSRSAINHMTAAAVGEVLWVLCGESASKLTDEIGYGNAAGILFNKGMGLPQKPEAKIEEIPDDPLRASAASVEEDVPRNPITGLRQEETEPKNPMADMTEEEKEREAERMMALFDRMERNPAMRLVENPMKDAVRSGKIDDWERSEQKQELERIREQEAADEAVALREISEWKKRTGKSS